MVEFEVSLLEDIGQEQHRIDIEWRLIRVTVQVIASDHFNSHDLVLRLTYF